MIVQKCAKLGTLKPKTKPMLGRHISKTIWVLQSQINANKMKYKTYLKSWYKPKTKSKLGRYISKIIGVLQNK